MAVFVLLLFPSVRAATIYVNGTYSTSTTWTSNNVYVVSSSLTLASGTTLTVNSGTVVKFVSGGTMNVNGGGVLNAAGDPANFIYFTSLKDDVGGDTNGDGTSTSPGKGDYSTIQILSGGSSTLNNAIIRYGKWLYNNSGATLNLTNVAIASNSSDGLYVAGGTVNITSSTFANNAVLGIETSNTSSNITLTSSTFYDNPSGAVSIGDTLNGFIFTHSGNTASGSGTRGILLSGIKRASSTLTKDLIPYVIKSSATVASGTTLTISPGVAVKMDTSGIYLGVGTNGVLDVEGTSTNPVYFTSLTDDSVYGDTNANGSSTAAKGDGGYIYLIFGSSSSTIRNAFVGYGNIYNIRHAGGTLTLSGDTVASSSNYGLNTASGTATVALSDFHHNSYGVYISGGTVTVSSSTIRSNSTNGANKTGSPTSTLTNNYWGGWHPVDYIPIKNSGPYNSGSNTSGAGNSVSSYIDYSSYIDAYLFDPTDASTSPSAVNNFNLLVGVSSTYVSSTDAALTTWRNATSGLISIATTTATSSVDLLIEDAQNGCTCATQCVVGQWDPNTTPKKIHMYTDAISACNLNSSNVINIVMHETGHSMGLAHSNTGNIMSSTVTTQTYLGPQDYSDYNFRWGNWWSRLWK